MKRHRMAVLLAAVAAAAGCSGAPNEQERKVRTLQRVRFLFDQYNDALRGQDARLIDAAAADLRKLATENFDVLQQDLSSPGTEEPAYAAFALGFSRNRGVVEPLVAATRHESPAVRGNAVASLGMLGFGDVPDEPFMRLLEDPEPSVRVSALFGLRPLVGPENDRKMLDAIHGRLSDPVMEVRNEALILLRKLRRKESVEAIVAKSVKDADHRVRCNAAVTLSAIGKDALDANPHLIQMLRDEVHKVVECAAEALNRINEKDFDRSYATWRDWYDDEQNYHYVCEEHVTHSQPMPGLCPTCKKKLERMPRHVKRVDAAPASYVCPDHPEVVTTSPSKCGRPGCGKSLILKK